MGLTTTNSTWATPRPSKYIYIYIQINKYIYIHTHIHIYIHTYIHTDIYIYMGLTTTNSTWATPSPSPPAVSSSSASLSSSSLAAQAAPTEEKSTRVTAWPGSGIAKPFCSPFAPPCDKWREFESRFQVRFPRIDLDCQSPRFFLLAFIHILTLYFHGY